MDVAQILLIVCVVSFTAMALVLDARTSKLPNKLTIPALALGVVFHVARGALTGGPAGAVEGLVFTLTGLGVGFILLLIPYLMGSGGGGDAKFMAALGAWIGAWYVLAVFIVGAYLGGVISLALRARKGGGAVEAKPANTSQPETRAEAQSRRRRTIVPFGVPAALATWAVLTFVVLTDRPL
jgi:prepilin peptidase CpaA